MATDTPATPASERPLPPLPEPVAFGSYTSCARCSPYRAPIFTAEQMRAYVLADRAAQAGSEWLCGYAEGHRAARHEAASAPQAVRRPLTREQMDEHIGPFVWFTRKDVLAICRELEAEHGIVPLAPQAAAEQALIETGFWSGPAALSAKRCQWPDCPHGTECVHAAPVAAQPAASVREVLQQALAALETAHTGLMWYRGMMPEYVDGSDDEADEEITAAIEVLSTHLSTALTGAQPAPAAPSVDALREGNWHHPDGGRIVGWHIPADDAERMKADAFCLPREVAECLARLIAAAPAAQPDDSAMEVLTELVEVHDAFHAWMRAPTITPGEEWDHTARMSTAWDRARALVAKETPHAR